MARRRRPDQQRSSNNASSASNGNVHDEEPNNTEMEQNKEKTNSSTQSHLSANDEDKTNFINHNNSDNRDNTVRSTNHDIITHSSNNNNEHFDVSEAEKAKIVMQNTVNGKLTNSDRKDATDVEKLNSHIMDEEREDKDGNGGMTQTNDDAVSSACEIVKNSHLDKNKKENNTNDNNIIHSSENGSAEEKDENEDEEDDVDIRHVCSPSDEVAALNAFALYSTERLKEVEEDVLHKCLNERTSNTMSGNTKIESPKRDHSLEMNGGKVIDGVNSNATNNNINNNNNNDNNNNSEVNSYDNSKLKESSSSPSDVAQTSNSKSTRKVKRVHIITPAIEPLPANVDDIQKSREVRCL